ncbi:HAD-like domain-containing protein [Mariannaea sp. PMI_226]|nr:HAD-like domain-containing protein [Mariannaea sp. PMI_226]
MLSRLAQASRLGLMAPRLTQPVAAPLRARSYPIASLASPWARSYADNKRPSQGIPHGQSSRPDKRTPSEAEQEVHKTERKAAEAEKESEEIAFHKLPDLTQGIPSTLEYEMKGTEKASQTALLETLQAAESESDRSARERPEYVSTSDRNRKKWVRFGLISSAVGAVATVLYLGRSFDAVEAERFPQVANSSGPSGFWDRLMARWSDTVAYYQDPSFEKLLPDPEASFERPYTLVLELDDLLVHSEWSPEHGWRVAKRPGFDYFVRYLSQYYEIVIFTTVPFGYGEALVRKLDPFRFIMWWLYREATKFQDGEIVKDLSYLNRDLSKVIVIDNKAENIRNQPENGIVLSPWKGDPSDTELIGLIPFLEYIHTMQYSDVRKVLKSFDGKHIPTEFARREAIARKEFEARRLAAEKNRHHSSGVGALGSMLGLKPSNMTMMVPAEGEQTNSEAFAQGKMLQDIARERGQRNYQLMEQEIKQNGEKWIKEEQEMMEKAQKEAMASMMSGIVGTFSFGGAGKEEAPSVGSDGKNLR